MRYSFFIGFIVLLMSCNNKQIQQDNTKIVEGEDGELLDSILTPYIKNLRKLTHNTAGLAIGVTKGERIIYARTFGYANIEQGEKADFNSVFHIASLSKPFTAVAIAKLIEQGQLDLNDKIITYIPEFQMKGDGYDSITIKHILTHTSGIPTNISTEDWTKPSYGAHALDENLEAVKNHSLEFDPGTKFNYSNSAFDILGIVISRVSGMSFSDYVSTHILQPAGMMNSTYSKPKDSLPPNFCNSYSYALQTQRWTPYPYNEKLYPSSGMLTTLPDMCRWAQIHLGKGKFQNYKVFNEENFELLVHPHFNTPWGNKIGLSWYLQSYLERPIIMHTGQDTGFESIIYIYPENDISIVVMANRDFSRTGRLINAASEVLFKEELKPYRISAKYKFTEAYNAYGIEKAKEIWNFAKKDTTDIYEVNDDDILTTGAILENRKKWNETKEILDFYNTLNTSSTYSWRLLGNANLNLGDTLTAKSCYQKCLDINPEYEKAKIALSNLIKSK
ncbi:serine hydrolase [Psychroserpens mesophilus]|uniref:serine hydrolase n=1 Tax=Psychroserpens mesophilus TaxID=325473 RepID=UPI0009FF3C15|nr:serine hydrolase [Psychroserpens mesophilus]